MNAIYEAAIEVERVCRDAGFRFCFIGGVAIQRWGKPRFTADVDLTVVTGFGNEEPYVDALLAKLKARMTDARQFALQHRTLLLTAANGIHVDVSLGAMLFEEHSIDRASNFAVDTTQAITTCSAEDLVVHKAFAGRDKDWLDIRGIIDRQPRIDTGVVWQELVPLLELKDDSVTEHRLRKLLGGA